MFSILSSLTSNMSFNTFCNICFTKENIIKLYGEENEPIINILIFFTSCPDVLNGIYLCINCCNKLEEYENFRELCLTNFVRFRYLYKEHKKQLEIRNAPDIEIKLKAFVDVNVERPSGTPLIENYEAAQALRNDTTCDVDITYKKESDGELTKIEWDELLNQNDLSHAENITLENDIKTCHEKYENDSSNEIQEIVESSSVGNDEPNSDLFEESQDPLVCDTVVKASPCHESAYDDTSDVSFNPKECVIDDSTYEEGFRYNENKTATSDNVYDVCAENFPCNSNLGLHMRAHAGEKPYKCDECDYIGTKLSSLKAHKRKHTGKKPYKCDECSWAFTDRAYLKSHKRIHTGERPYKCDECDYRCLEGFALKKHKRIHTGERPYNCNECGLGFKQLAHLTTHKLIHTDEKPYNCDECGFRFKRQCDLKRHKLTHTGEKPHKCDECGLGFGQRYNLKVHKFSKHSSKKRYKGDESASVFVRRVQLDIHELQQSDIYKS